MNQTPLQAEEHKALEDNKAVRNSVFIGAAFVALATAVGSIWKEFYDEVKKLNPIKGLGEAKDQRIEAAYAKGAETPLGYVFGEVRAANKEYTDGVAKVMRDIGIPKNPIVGTIERTKRLGLYNISETAMKTGASLAITLGGWYLLNQNMRIKNSNARQDQNLQELARRIDAAEQRHSETYERSSGR